MVNPSLNFSFLSNWQQHFEENNSIKTPKVQALTNLMNLSGVCRLFERNDVYELVKRIQLILPEQDLIDTFFEKDVLLEFLFEDEPHNLTLSDLIEFIGFETADLNNNHTSFEAWAINIPQYKSTAAFLAEVAGMFNIDTSYSNVRRDKNNITLDLENLPEDVNFNHEDVIKAEKFAKTLVEKIPSNNFERLKKDFPNKFKILELRNAPFNEPIFNFESFPKEKQKTLWLHFQDDMENFDHKPTKDYYLKLINLAWLWANGFVIDTDINCVHIDFRIKNFDPVDLETEDESQDLLHLNILHNLDEIFPLLEDPEISKLSERPWEHIKIFDE